MIVFSFFVVMVFGVFKGMVVFLLVINFCFYFILVDIVGFFLNKVFDCGSFVFGGGLFFGVFF